MTSARKLIGILFPGLICFAVLIIAYGNSSIVQSISEQPRPGTLGKLDWVDEIQTSARLLNFWVPFSFVLVITHAVYLGAQRQIAWMYLGTELCAAITATIYSVAIWILIDRLHGPSVDLWASHIWWR